MNLSLYHGGVFVRLPVTAGALLARLQSPEGAVVGISFAPWMHDGT